MQAYIDRWWAGLLLVAALVSCGDTGAQLAPAQCTAPHERVVHEHHFKRDPSLRATPKDVVLVRLEGKGAATDPDDSGDANGDVVSYRAMGTRSLAVSVASDALERVRVIGANGELAQLRNGALNEMVELPSDDFSIVLEPQSGQDTRLLFIEPIDCSGVAVGRMGRPVDAVGPVGVYISEVPLAGSLFSAPLNSGGVVFMGVATGGPTSIYMPIASIAQYQSVFNEPTLSSHLGYAVDAYFRNGGGAVTVMNIDLEGGAGLTGALMQKALVANNVTPQGFGDILVIPDAVALDPAIYLDVFSTVVAAIRTNTERQMFAVLDAPYRFSDVADLSAWVTSNASTLRDTHAAMYFPAVTVSTAAGGSFHTGVVGALAARLGANDSWVAPSHAQALLMGLTVDSTLSAAELASLATIGVNPVQSQMGTAAPLTSVTLAPDTVSLGTIENRRLSNSIINGVFVGLQPLVFEQSTSTVWSLVQADMAAYLDLFWRRGAFAGSTASDAYRVQCDANNNPVEFALMGVLVVSVAFLPQMASGFTNLTFTQHVMSLDGL